MNENKIEVKYYENVNVKNDTKNLIKTESIVIDEKFTFSDLLDESTFRNGVPFDCETNQYFFQLPYIDSKDINEPIRWCVYYKSCPVLSMMSFYHLDYIGICVDAGGIGSTFDNSLVIAIVNGIITILGPAIAEILKPYFIEMISKIPGVNHLIKRNANFKYIGEYLSSKDYFDENSLMKKFDFDNKENLELVMYGLGYVKDKKGMYSKMKKTDSPNI